MVNMAQPPPSGARRKVAQFVQDNINEVGLNFKAIQPQLLSVIDGTFYWAVKVIEIKGANTVGIARKYEAGFVILTHEENLKKIKAVYTALKGHHTKLSKKK